jgi:hypothetical protein
MNKLPILGAAMLTIGWVACAARDGEPELAPRTSTVTSDAPKEPQNVESERFGSIPVGQELDVRLRNTLSSETAKVEQRFEATTVVDLRQDGRVLVPAGSVVEGIVADVDKAGRVDRTGSLTLTFDRMNVRGRNHEIHATATEVFESRGIRDDAGKAGIGAGVGGVVGGIIGGVKGAILGAVIGAGGAIAATNGNDIDLPAGSIVRIRMDSPVRVG